METHNIVLRYLRLWGVILHYCDGWTNLVEQVYEQCRNRWHYLIPDAEVDRQLLRSICLDTLEFSNAFLSRYHRFVLDELYQENPKNQLTAVKLLGRIIYLGDQEIMTALKRLKQANHEALRLATYENEEKIQQHS